MTEPTRFRGLAPWRPFGWRPFDGFENRLRSIMDEFFGEELPTRRTERIAWDPAVELAEKDRELVLTAELPGLKQDDVEIELENDILTIRGEKAEKREKKDEKQRYHVWERSYGKFQRSFTLPLTVDADKINAAFEDGVLKVHMPKTAEAKGRRIAIKTK